MALKPGEGNPTTTDSGRPKPPPPPKANPWSGPTAEQDTEHPPPPRR